MLPNVPLATGDTAVCCALPAYPAQNGCAGGGSCARAASGRPSRTASSTDGMRIERGRTTPGIAPAIFFHLVHAPATVIGGGGGAAAGFARRDDVVADGVRLAAVV